jgi:hypothetical protein
VRRAVVTRRGPDGGDGPQRFIRNWLRFSETRPVRAGVLWKLIATVAAFLAASALLAVFSGHLQH